MPQTILAQNVLAPLYTVQFVLLLACAAAYYKAADVENVPPLLWSGLSVMVFLLTWMVLRWGWFGNLVGQGALLLGIAIFRALRDRPNV